MRLKNILGIVFLALGIKFIILFGLFTLTGGIINNSPEITSHLFSLIGLVFIGVSFLIFAMKEKRKQL